MARTKMTKDERRARRQERRAARLAAAGVEPRQKLSRKDRRAKRRAEKLARKVAARPPVLIDRGDITDMLVGPRSRFTEEQLAPLYLDLTDVMGSYWIILYTGDGYTDIERCGTKTSAEWNVKFLKRAGPKAKVKWI